MAVALWAVVFSAFLVLPAMALADVVPPHVSTSQDTDACAMCHRAHTSAAGVTWEDDLGTEHNALIVGDSTAEVGDTELCYTCHGYGSLGASVDVQGDFEKSSYHRLAPEASDYGPTRKECSDCHDSHGSAKTASDTPYPALLRSFDTSRNGVYQGAEYCATCHPDRPVDVWSGIEIWRQTAHADITPTASGTEIVCSVCHAPHGSSNMALITEQLQPPSAPETVSVPANDRWLCFGCHPGAKETYPGGLTYQSSTHGSTAATVSADTEWATRMPAESAETSRVAGECQVCHSPMGSDDGSGTPIAKLANDEGADLCYRCHGAGSTVATDVASVMPTRTAGIPEVVAAYGATAATRQFGFVHAYTRESSATTTLATPREYLAGRIGPMTTGDIDGDGKAEVLVTRAGTTGVSVLRRSALNGLTSQPGTATLLAEPSFIAVADVLPDLGGLNELVASNGVNLWVYRWNGTQFAPVAGAPIALGAPISGLATGDVVGTTQSEIVATTYDPAPGVPDQLVIVTGGSGSLAVNGAYTLPGKMPQGPSVGDLDGAPDGKGEIAVAYGDESTNYVGVYSPSGLELARAGSSAGQVRAQRTIIRDILWGVTAAGRTGAEVAVTRADPNDGSRVDVFPQTTVGTLAASVAYTFAPYTNPAEMAAGDVDGDDRDELLVAMAGSIAHDTPGGISVVQPDSTGTTLGSADYYASGGVEHADSAPGPAWVAVVELGALGSSRHAIDAVADTHVSTETADFARHVDCNDCHNVHEATSTVAAAPAVPGPLKGTWGVSVSNEPANSITYALKRGVDYEYELCLKCHSGWSASGDSRDIASEIDTRNASYHAIEQTSTVSQANDETFVGGWTNDSVLYCTDCHGNSKGGEAKGPHASAQSPILKKQYSGILPSSDQQICYSCHNYEVYYTGTLDEVGMPGSHFWKNNQPRRLHRLHTFTNGINCDACHSSHGSTLAHLIRTDVGYTHNAAGGGSCTNGCHANNTRAYTGR